MPSRQAALGTAPLDLVENAVHWLRRAPIAVHLLFLVGTLPFLLSLLWFWADMSRGAYADRRCASGAAGVAVLYLWMKTWHSVYCAELHALVSAEPPKPWTIRRWLRVLAAQTSLQPWTWFTILLSVPTFLIPLPWAFAWSRNIDVLADEEAGRVGGIAQSAWREAKRWPGQNHGLIGLLLLAGTLVTLNVGIVLALLPFLLKILIGLDSDFTLSADAMILNSTFLLAVGALSYLIMMPVILASYTLRSFEGSALSTGADLRARFRHLAAASGSGLANGLSLALWLGIAVPLMTPSPLQAAPLQNNTAKVETLDRAIESVLERPDFTWRERRELGPTPTDLADDPSLRWPARFSRWWQRQIKSWGDALKAPFDRLGDSASAFLKWLFGNPRNPPLTPTPSPRGTDEADWISGVQLAVYLAIAIALGLLARYGWQLWKQHRSGAKPPVANPPPAETPDLTSETVSAAALPESGWLHLAQDLAARGEFRLAVRAIYLGELAHLAEREWVRLGPSKTNREYLRELQRRAAAQPRIGMAFIAAVGLFDRVWYGLHPATAETVAEAEAHFADLRNAA